MSSTVSSIASPTAPVKPLQQTAARHAFGAALVFLCCAAIFGPPLWRGECPAYRDAGHFYYPTLAHTTERWANGEVPLWNDLDNAGQPLAADATSAVFYPGRVLLHAPIGLERAITLFVLAHWLLAVFGTRRLAKRFTSSTDLQYLAAILFGLSGYVAGQCFNVVFLVGAAWLPWAWNAWESLRGSREPRKAASLAIPLSMMVLGGDPQIAYHVVLLALLDSISWRRTAREAANALMEPTLVEGSSAPGHLTWPWFRSRWLVLAFACSLALGLCAIQVLPSLTWTVRTDRAVFDEPRSIWEWFASAGANPNNPARLSAIFTTPEANTHDENLYDFSFAPIRLLEFLLPGVFGELGPHYQNWLKALTPSQRWWTNTNYLGLLPLGAVAIALLGQWSNRLVRSAAYVAAISLVSSFGVWGLGSLWRFVSQQADGAGNNVGPAVGGLYWAWVSFLPGYSGFRYPSKWLVFFSLAMVLLAARGLDLYFSGDHADARTARYRTAIMKWSPHLLVMIALLSSTGWIALLLLGPNHFASWAKTPAHPLFGPFDVEGACRCARFALARTFVVSLILAMPLFAMNHTTLESLKDTFATFIRRLLMLFTIFEVLVTVWAGPIFDREAYWMSSPQVPPFAAKFSPTYRIYRASSARLQPSAWRKEFDTHRLEAIRQFELSSLFPRHHWLAKVWLVEVHGTTVSADYAALLEFLHRCPPDDSQEPAWRKTFHPYDLLAARYCIAPQGAKVRDAEPIDSPAAQAAGLTLWDRKVTPPRAWMAQSVALLPELRSASRSEIAKRSRSILLDQVSSEGAFRDLLAEAIVESDAPDPLFSEICEAAPLRSLANPTWKIDEPERIELEVELTQPGLLVLADAFDSGWSAVRITEGAPGVEIPIFRTNRVLRGVCLPAGRHVVRFQYRPWEIRWGGVISLLSWVIALPAATLLSRRRRRDHRDSPSSSPLQTPPASRRMRLPLRQ